MRANFQSHDRNLWREEREEGRKEALEGGGLPEFGAIEISSLEAAERAGGSVTGLRRAAPKLCRGRRGGISFPRHQAAMAATSTRRGFASLSLPPPPQIAVKKQPTRDREL